MESKLLRRELLDAYQQMAPDASPGAILMIQRLADRLFARGVRVEIGVVSPLEEKVIHHSLDPEARIVWVSKLWNQIMGYRSRAAIGKHVSDIFTPESMEHFPQRWDELLAGGKLGPTQVTLLTSRGDPIPAKWKSEVLRDSEGMFDRTFARIIVYVPRLAAG